MSERKMTAELEKAVGHTFSDTLIIARALTHSSYANEQKSRGELCECNERMEFLGDSVLSLVTTEYLFSHMPDVAEGEMSKIRAATVCEKALFEFAVKIELGSYLYLGHGEEVNGGRTRPSLVSDAFEALLAAIYLDAGIDEVKRFLLPFVSAKIDEIVAHDAATDYKTTLQQIIQQEQGELLHYEVISESGPPHNRVFKVSAYLNSNVIGTGSGRSKREAEQNAAKNALSLFGN